ncbi:unnamed protein product [Clonostachys rosea f. rosea IK726]|uniref:Uncharacterized protein n=1 Tax=Clonostachys rosea f. rosea IK726 TaxID=1349383 RepID=A0ACA9TB12_BIOOC|nr:unnamed protein product [Clonostachys rosea f. rosea IK726]
MSRDGVGIGADRRNNLMTNIEANDNLGFSGSDFNYEVKEWKLTFGDIIALASDFYSRWQLDGCIPSISDD